MVTSMQQLGDSLAFEGSQQPKQNALESSRQQFLEQIPDVVSDETSVCSSRS
jgi:hypothetical protein